ncbi:MAG: M48 family peptidase, partial [Chloroflexota bacterium]
MTSSPEQPDQQRQAKARTYARTRRVLYVVDLLIGAAFLVALLATGASNWLRDTFAYAYFLQVGLYFLVVLVLYTVVLLPSSFYGGYVLPKRYGLLSQGLRGWVIDELKGFGLSILLGLLIIEVLYWLIASNPAWWWLLAAGAMLLFTVVLANLAPILILPLFYKLEPLRDQALAARLTALAARAGQRVRGVYEMNLSAKSTTANAALMGLGNTRRIMLTDTLIQRYTPDEIEAVLAHELGHHVHRDIPMGIAIQTGVTLVSFFLADRLLLWLVPRLGYASIADIATFPLLALVLGAFMMIAMPLQNSFSRWRENQADRYALSLTRAPADFISMMTKLTDQNLSEAEPSRWVELVFYDHPSS